MKDDDCTKDGSTTWEQRHSAEVTHEQDNDEEEDLKADFLEIKSWPNCEARDFKEIQTWASVTSLSSQSTTYPCGIWSLCRNILQARRF